MSKKRGGISIFLAVTFLSLIVFVMSIVEVTRVQILRAQAERMVISATQSVLAGYDSALKNEYGIFARNPEYGDCFFVMPDLEKTPEKAMAMDFEYYLGENVKQTPDQLHMSLVDQYVFRVEDDAYYELAPLSLVRAAIVSEKTLVDIATKDLSYVKQEMLDTMELRLPLIGLSTILETFGAAEKLGKTTRFVEGKNDQIEAAASIEDLYLQLYATMDGVTVNVKDNSLTVVDARWVNRIKRNDASYMLAYEGIAKPIGGTPSPETPIVATKAYQSAYELMLLSTEGLAADYADYKLTSAALKSKKKDVTSTQKKKDHLNDAISDINKSIRKKEAKGSKADEEDQEAAKSEIAALKVERDALSEEIRGYGLTLKQQKDKVENLEDELSGCVELITLKMKAVNHQQSIIDGHKETINHLTEGGDNYLNSNQEANSVMHQIQDKAEDIETSIDSFIENSEKNEDLYIASTYEQSINELESLKDSYGAGSEKQKALTGNLTEIQKTVEENIKALEKVITDVALVEDGASILVGVFDKAGVDRTMLVDLKAISGISDFYVTYLSSHSWSDKYTSTEVIASLKSIEAASNDYRIAPLLDYSGFDQSEEALEEKNRFRDIVDGMKAFLNAYDLDKITDRYNPEDVALPQGLISELIHMTEEAEDLKLNTNYNEEDYQGDGAPDDDQLYMEAGSNSGGDTSLLINAKEHLLLNEYAIGMFRSFPDKQREDETLAGYPLKDHPYETELEYIYTGIRDSDQALYNVALQIFAVRTAFNLVHLSTDPVKRAFIMKVAAAIAGPISAGLLTIVVAMFVGLLWATIESFVDLDRLLAGDKVPLLKTGASWFTSPEGLVNLSIDTVSTLTIDYTERFVDAVSDKSKEKMDELKGKVDEETAYAVDQELNQLYEQVEIATDGAIDALDQVYYQALDAVLLSYREAGDKVKASEYLSPSAEGNSLIAQGIAELEEALDDGAQKGYVELIRAKNAVVEAQEAKLLEVKKAIAATIKKDLNDSVDHLFIEMNEEIDKLADKGKTVSSDFIKNNLESHRKTLNDQAAEFTKDIKSTDAKTDKTMLIPSIDYEMYLRLFMIADSQHLNNRVARMLDLIDYNLIYGQKGSVTSEDLILKDYVTNIEGEAQFKVDYLFIDLPLSSIKMKITDKYFTIKARAVNGYEQ